MSINIATDVNVTKASLNKTSWKGLQQIARQGSEQQQALLLSYSRTSLPADMHAWLKKIVTGQV
jgi:hypothetical protein